MLGFWYHPLKNTVPLLSPENHMAVQRQGNKTIPVTGKERGGLHRVTIKYCPAG